MIETIEDDFDGLYDDITEEDIKDYFGNKVFNSKKEIEYDNDLDLYIEVLL